jgi:Zn-dependent alcohol dehydrogenase
MWMGWLGLRPSNSIPLVPVEPQVGQNVLIGSSCDSISQRIGIPETLRHYKNGSLKIAELVSRSHRLDDIVAGYEDLAAGRNIRCVVRFDGPLCARTERFGLP